MLKNRKSIIVVVSLIFIGVALIFGSSLLEDGEKESSIQLDYEKYVSNLEEKIESFLLKIQGINKAEVIITLDTSSEQIYAQSNDSYVIIDKESGESPINITEIYPTVRGIAIACTNGNSDETKMKITKLISAYLDISTNRIEIVGIK